MQIEKQLLYSLEDLEKKVDNNMNEYVLANSDHVCGGKVKFFKRYNLDTNHIDLNNNLNNAAVLNINEVKNILSKIDNIDNWEIWKIKTNIELVEKCNYLFKRFKIQELKKQISQLEKEIKDEMVGTNVQDMSDW